MSFYYITFYSGRTFKLQQLSYLWNGKFKLTKHQDSSIHLKVLLFHSKD